VVHLRTAHLPTPLLFCPGEHPPPPPPPPTRDARRKGQQNSPPPPREGAGPRHSVFFHRFFREVIGAGDTIGSTLAYTEPQLGWGYRNVFDRLDRMGEELRKDKSLPKFAQAIALYHMVVEATLAQPGQHFIEDY